MSRAAFYHITRQFFIGFIDRLLRPAISFIGKNLRGFTPAAQVDMMILICH
jgi:hypothetical protein